MAFTGLSFVVGNKSIIEKAKNYPKRSYYCNLFLQYDYFEKTGEMHFLLNGKMQLGLTGERITNQLEVVLIKQVSILL